MSVNVSIRMSVPVWGSVDVTSAQSLGTLKRSTEVVHTAKEPWTIPGYTCVSPICGHGKGMNGPCVLHECPPPPFSRVRTSAQVLSTVKTSISMTWPWSWLVAMALQEDKVWLTRLSDCYTWGCGCRSGAWSGEGYLSRNWPRSSRAGADSVLVGVCETGSMHRAVHYTKALRNDCRRLHQECTTHNSAKWQLRKGNQTAEACRHPFCLM